MATQTSRHSARLLCYSALMCTLIIVSTLWIRFPIPGTDVMFTTQVFFVLLLRPAAAAPLLPVYASSVCRHGFGRRPGVFQHLRPRRSFHSFLRILAWLYCGGSCRSFLPSEDAKKAEPGFSGGSAGNRCNLRGGASLCGDSERRVPFRAGAFFRADVQLLLGFPSA